MSKNDVRVFVVYGQGGTLWSAGFYKFANRLQSLGYNVVDEYAWGDPQRIVNHIHNYQAKHNVLIGYSMGACAITWVQAGGQPIDLLVGYDPSLGFFRGLVPAAPCSPIGRNVKRAICYKQDYAVMAGGAVYKGHNVEVVSTSLPHLAIQSSEKLHRMTLQALAEVGE